MQKNGFYPSEMELTWLCTRFDRKLTGHITYAEFMEELLPAKSLLGEICNINLLKKTA